MKKDPMKLLEEVEKLSNKSADLYLLYAMAAKRAKQIVEQDKEDLIKEFSDIETPDGYTTYLSEESSREAISKTHEQREKPFIRAVQDLIDGDIEYTRPDDLAV